MSFPINNIRSQFPALHQQVYKRPLVYFDNAATTQKPQVVIDALKYYYENQNANIHRGVHWLSDMSSEAYENSRQKVASFINAEKKEEERENKAAVIEAGREMEKSAAKQMKHQPKQSMKKPKHQVRMALEK